MSDGLTPGRMAATMEAEIKKAPSMFGCGFEPFRRHAGFRLGWPRMIESPA
jgi:hypothetical protein